MACVAEGCAWWDGACMAGGHAWWGVCMAGGGHVWQILRAMINERAVRLLLECILVKLLCSHFNSGPDLNK